MNASLPATMTSEPQPSDFVDRRGSGESLPPRGVERRQFSNSYSELSAPARELGQAIDRYKLERRRRFISYEEMLEIIQSLGYQKT